MSRLLGFAGLAALLSLVGLANADTHHNAESLLGNHLKTNGKHELHKNGEHTAHAHVQNGKVSKVEVIHKTKGAVAVTKYKSTKKHHAKAEAGVEHIYVGLNDNGTDSEPTDRDGTEPVGLGIAWVGWGYRVGIITVVYWFPVAIVVGADQGAILYTP